MNFGKIPCLVLVLLSLVSWNDSPKCYKELQVDFFDEQIVMQAFDLYTWLNIYQGQWSHLARRLKEEERRVPALIRAKTNKMIPSPIDYPFQPDKAEEILLETLFEVFEYTMHKYAFIYNDAAIKGMFNYIKEKQAPRLEACLAEKRKKIKKSSP